MVSRTLADGKVSVWGLSDLIGERRELDNRAPARKLFCPERAHVTSVTSYWLKQVPWSGLMSMGWKNTISSKERKRIFKRIIQSSTRAFPEASSQEGTLVLVDSWVFVCVVEFRERLWNNRWHNPLHSSRLGCLKLLEGNLADGIVAYEQEVILSASVQKGLACSCYRIGCWGSPALGEAAQLPTEMSQKPILWGLFMLRVESLKQRAFGVSLL